MSFAQRIAEKIKQEKIKPIAPWYFSCKNWIFWISFGVSLILGSIAFAMLLVALVQNEFPLREILSEMLWIPIIWVGTFSLFIASAWYAIWHTKTGYKIHSGIWIGSNLLFSFLIGTVLYVVLMNHWNEGMMQFSGMKKAQDTFWNRPEEGFLWGKLEMQNDEVLLIDGTGKSWHIIFSEKVQKKHPLLFMQLTKADHQEKFLPPHPVKLQGTQTGISSFQADTIRPFMRGVMREEEMQFMPIPTEKKPLPHKNDDPIE